MQSSQFLVNLFLKQTQYYGKQKKTHKQTIKQKQ